MDSLPRLLSDLTPAPGEIKTDYEDFVVEEIPLYEPSGEGTHTYFRIEKAGLSTEQAAHDVARQLNVRRREIGYAGQKDARAVTRQWFSVEHVDPDLVRAIQIPRVRILEVSRHRNKLKLGHLRENRFVIRVRNTQPHRLKEMRAGLNKLSERGVPNYFGRQRFGGRGDTWAVGAAIARRNPEDAIDVLLGRPADADHGDILRARKLYEKGQFADAASAWPGMFRNERRALKALIRSNGNRKRALAAIDRSSRTFYLAAYQSHLFNRVVAARLPSGLEKLMLGDLAQLHGSGGVFSVEDVAKEQPRADSFEISPTGPLFGYRMTQPSGRPGEIESEILSAEELPSDAFRGGPVRMKGVRRAFRFRPTDAVVEVGADARGPYLELRFGLPRGCYATSLLRELFDDTANLGAAHEEADETEFAHA